MLIGACDPMLSPSLSLSSGRLFSGAGGGFLMVISETPVDGGHQITINHDFSAKPFPSDTVADEPKPM